MLKGTSVKHHRNNWGSETQINPFYLTVELMPNDMAKFFRNYIFIFLYTHHKLQLIDFIIDRSSWINQSPEIFLLPSAKTSAYQMLRSRLHSTGLSSMPLAVNVIGRNYASRY
jgi:hypothetical protein